MAFVSAACIDIDYFAMAIDQLGLDIQVYHTAIPDQKLENMPSNAVL